VKDTVKRTKRQDIDWEKQLQNTYLIKGLFLKHRESQNTQRNFFSVLEIELRAFCLQAVMLEPPPVLFFIICFSDKVLSFTGAGLQPRSSISAS
jgi:hypothetical protein